MIKRILVPLDRSRYTDAAVETACAVAAANHAEIEGIVVSPVLATTETEKLRDGLLASFRATCDSHSVRHQQSRNNGLPSSEILSTARMFDLIVMGLRTHYHLANPDTEGNALTSLLSATSTPILAVPPGDPVPLESILVAYDGSVPAARALREFTRIAHQLDDPEVTVVCCDPVQKDSEALVAEAKAYLKAYSFGRVETATCQGGLREFVTENYLGDADLVVAGFHAKSTVREFFVGSFTKSLIEQGRTALLLAH
ncbi:MAG: nucleotide-binding universal stress UspA family protein [Verrucomicrobiales bacterium]|jgi:nucleotide-binding universal stress UspA family protein